MQYLRNVVTLELNADHCIGCGRCLEVCPHAVFVLEDRRARIGSRDDCMECGACVRNCPAGAIRVETGVGCAGMLLRKKMRGSPRGGSDCWCCTR
jgi:NAD-dependent dihydropyrimidine dehydrogenase PreA subunit